MKFGKNLRDAIEGLQPEYRDKFLDYKGLKKILKSLPTRTAGDEEETDFIEDTEDDNEKLALTEEERGFINALNEELSKFNEFFIEKEEVSVITLERLERNLKLVIEEDLQSLSDLRKAFIQFHGDVILLQHWSALNYAALVKILKKHDKNSSLTLRSSFLQKVLHQPFYNTEVLMKLVHQAEEAHKNILDKQLELGGSGARELLRMPFDTDLSVSPDVEVDEAFMRRAEEALRTWQRVKSKSIPTELPEDDGTGARKRASESDVGPLGAKAAKIDAA
mmetsp:Transcript_27818/g.33758  ORF Transcript_27818/g.33758 Transcript_27818/m.33758 type:complete len:278 (-) Transcript_27818:1259-2092(-)|eukprot:CAMPEP_0197852816 /NCGR_PEP_ID=MMETSP1438-20131217/21475_1 /TAXON_ID=1461541 /ORGANISM="Pterosperma sp., Strain CCMP1384" /LENGTH=277 /DNA_ID=CAMNT_0043467009 /DNA_START=200 /DNA_END=1033 /DNA_ORIENTATION=-